MFKSLYWMFQQKNFVKHISFLCFASIFSYILMIAFAYITNFYSKGSLEYNVILGISTFFFCVPILLFQGYFWNMTENIIDRKEDLVINDVYDGIAKKNYIIELPDLNFFKLVWRGIASIVAGVLSLLPYYLLIFFAIIAGTFTLLPPWILVVIYIFYILLFPALFWNYAKENSVFAVLDILKAGRIIDSAGWKYFLTIIFFLIVNGIGFIIDYFFYSTFLVSAGKLEIEYLANLSLLIYAIFIGIKTIYTTYVNSYLLGTLAPTSEY